GRCRSARFARHLHAGSGRAGAAARIERLVAVGGAAAAAVGAAAGSAGMAPASVEYVAESDQAAEIVAALVRPGDVVLVKGWRGIKTERVVERLKAERG